MRVCASCQVEKKDTDFRKFGRGLRVLCKACEGSPTDEAASPAPVKLAASLEIPSGLGFRASLEDDTLQIEQDRADETGSVYTHHLSLARHEASRLIEWIASQVETFEGAQA